MKWFILVLASYYLLFCLVPDIRIAKINVYVVDEQGKPVEDALIGVVFKSGHLTKDEIRGKTDHNGKYSIWARTPDGTVVGDITKKGYYDSGFGYSFFKRKFGFWMPWNGQQTVLLRPIINPVPMYVRNIDRLDVPELGKEIGFDLMEADWIKPFGKGKHSDFIFRIDYLNEGVDELSISLAMTFPNKNDGMQLAKEDNTFYSQFKLIRLAPSIGYNNKIIKRYVSSIRRKEFINDHKDTNNYIFRVRTELDEHGKVKRAMYGKILREIGFFTPDLKTGKAGVKMHYYLNPDYSNNLEFDPKRNLFTNLPKDEKVDMP